MRISLPCVLLSNYEIEVVESDLTKYEANLKTWSITRGERALNLSAIPGGSVAEGYPRALDRRRDMNGASSVS